MSRLISLVDKSNAEGDNALCEKTLSRPVMAFVIQRHDLDNLQIAMRHALRKAVCRVFAMQVNIILLFFCLLFFIGSTLFTRRPEKRFCTVDGV